MPSNSHERITPFALRKETRFDRPENKTREGRFHRDLLNRARSREVKLV